ncbi:11-beta-hydroxysteroid dehydrogenase-like 6-like protein [Drosera capensis]
MIRILLNLLLPPLTLIVLLIVLPIHEIFKFSSWAWRCISVENVSGKVVLITGAASGIGEQLAYEYARRGARLALVDIKENSLRTCFREMSQRKMTASASLTTLFSTSANAMDHLVNNAGIMRPLDMIEDTADISSFIPLMDINFWGTVYSIHFAVPHLRKSKGKIIVIASCCGWLPIAKTAIYNASKAALISLCETLRTEIGPEINITTVTPGMIRTNLIRDDYLEKVPIGMFPSESAIHCAKEICSSACRGDRYLTTPSWVSVTYLITALCPQAATWEADH